MYKTDKCNRLPVLFLSLLFVPLGAGLCLLRLVSVERNMHLCQPPDTFSPVGGRGRFALCALFPVPLWPAEITYYTLQGKAVCQEDPPPGPLSRCQQNIS